MKRRLFALALTPGWCATAASAYLWGTLLYGRDK